MDWMILITSWILTGIGCLAAIVIAAMLGIRITAYVCDFLFRDDELDK